ncbi:hypothetical protein ACH4YO_41905 [Streptomyces noursei]|uniref:hypothetical protein n=1 Tax=Streptomyces noursei TaxID=1971 RepID=UPI0033C6F9A3
MIKNSRPKTSANRHQVPLAGECFAVRTFDEFVGEQLAVRGHASAKSRRGTAN